MESIARQRHFPGERSHVRRDRPPGIEQHANQVGGVEVLPVGNQLNHRRIEQIDPGVHRELLPRLLFYPRDLGAVERELAVRDVDLVDGDSHRHRGHSLAPVERPHGAEVALGQDVGVHHEEGLVETIPHEQERAHRAERLRLLHILDGDTEPLAITQTRAGHVGLVVKRDEHADDAGLT